jgi:hypothetical protein
MLQKKREELRGKNGAKREELKGKRMTQKKKIR